MNLGITKDISSGIMGRIANHVADENQQLINRDIKAVLGNGKIHSTEMNSEIINAVIYLIQNENKSICFNYSEMGLWSVYNEEDLIHIFISDIENRKDLIDFLKKEALSLYNQEKKIDKSILEHIKKAFYNILPVELNLEDLFDEDIDSFVFNVKDKKIRIKRSFPEKGVIVEVINKEDNSAVRKEVMFKNLEQFITNLFK